MASIETLIIQYLSSHEDIEYSVYGDTPDKEVPDSYYLVEKTGSRTRDHLCTAQIVAQSYSSDSKESASRMNETVISAMRGLTSLSAVSGCRLNSDYDYTDLAKKRWRYQAVFDVTYTREV